MFRNVVVLRNEVAVTKLRPPIYCMRTAACLEQYINQCTIFRGQASDCSLSAEKATRDQIRPPRKSTPDSMPMAVVPHESPNFPWPACQLFLPLPSPLSLLLLSLSTAIYRRQCVGEGHGRGYTISISSITGSGDFPVCCHDISTACGRCSSCSRTEAFQTDRSHRPELLAVSSHQIVPKRLSLIPSGLGIPKNSHRVKTLGRTGDLAFPHLFIKRHFGKHGYGVIVDYC